MRLDAKIMQIATEKIRNVIILILQHKFAMICVQISNNIFKPYIRIITVFLSFSPGP